MTKKTFYQFVLKVAGLFTLKEFIETFLQMISLVFYDSSMNSGAFISILSIFMMLAIKIGLIYACLIKTDKIIEILKLADDDTVLSDWYFDMNTLLSLAIIIIGLLQIIDVLPILIRQIFLSIDTKRFDSFSNNLDKSSYVVPVLKLLIGFLLISNYKLIIKWINNTSETKDKLELNE